MTTKDSIVIVGAGGFGREIADVAEAMRAAGHRIDIAGFIDDTPKDENLRRLEARGLAYLGTSDEYLAGPVLTQYVVGVGSPSVRERIARRFDAAGMTAVTLVHPSVTMGSQVVLGVGTVVCAGVRLTTNIEVGRHVHLNLNVTVGHDSTVEDFVSVNPLASISGDCQVRRGVLMGVASVVLQGLEIGEGATVGGSACVVKPVPPGVVVKGVPAR